MASTFLYKRTTSSKQALVPIPSKLTRDTIYNPGMNISRYITEDGILYYAFQDNLHTMKEPEFRKYLIVSIYIPDIMGISEDVRGLFFVRSTKSRIWDFKADIIKDKSVGKHGCGYRIDLGSEEILVSGKKKEIRRALRFRQMRSYPFLLRNLSVAFFHTDMGSNDDLIWRDYNKNWDGVGVEEQLVFDADFDLLKTRNATLKDIQ